MILEELSIEPGEFSAGTGWVIKPEGACRGDLCIPLPAGVAIPGDRMDVAMIADSLAMPLVADPERDRWALGPATISGRALSSAVAPELTLPDVDGNPFSLSSLHGQKVLLVAWASW